MVDARRIAGWVTAPDGRRAVCPRCEGSAFIRLGEVRDTPFLPYLCMDGRTPWQGCTAALSGRSQALQSSEMQGIGCRALGIHSADPLYSTQLQGTVWGYRRGSHCSQGFLALPGDAAVEWLRKCTRMDLFASVCKQAVPSGQPRCWSYLRNRRNHQKHGPGTPL